MSVYIDIERLLIGMNILHIEILGRYLSFRGVYYLEVSENYSTLMHHSSNIDFAPFFWEPSQEQALARGCPNEEVAYESWIQIQW